MTYCELRPDLSDSNRDGVTASIGYQKHDSCQAVWCGRFDEHGGYACVELCGLFAQRLPGDLRYLVKAIYNEHRDNDVYADGQSVVWDAEGGRCAIEEEPAGLERHDELKR